jgi:hypothetical protein
MAYKIEIPKSDGKTEDKFKIKLNFVDGTSIVMFGDYTQKAVDTIYKQMKREPNKRLYLFGTQFSSVKNVEVTKK